MQEELRNESSFNFLTREAHFLSRDQFFRAGAGALHGHSGADFFKIIIACS